MPQKLLALIGLSFALSSVADSGPHELVVVVTDIAPLEGELRVALFLSKTAHENRQGDDGAIVQVDASRLTVTFPGIGASEASVLLFHDVDGDGKLGTNFLGIPNEPYASSTGQRGRFGPPSWRRAKVPLSERTMLQISLR